MIVKEPYKTRDDGINLYRTYSDANFKIQKVGTDEIYDEAIDIQDAPYTYEETDIQINNGHEIIDEELATAEDYEKALAKLGVE